MVDAKQLNFIEGCKDIKISNKIMNKKTNTLESAAKKIIIVMYSGFYIYDFYYITAKKIVPKKNRRKRFI